MSYEEVGIHTCACGLETIQEDGVCLICKANEKNRKPIYGIIGEESEERRAESEESENQNSMLSPAGAGSKLLAKANGGERMREFKDGHRKCKVEDCEKYAVRDGLCTAHYKVEHGHAPVKSAGVTKGKICIDCLAVYQPTSNVQKRCTECKAKKTREYGEATRERRKIAAPAARNDKRKKTASAKSLDNISQNVTRAGTELTTSIVIDKLIAERDRIDQAIAVIERYI